MADAVGALRIVAGITLGQLLPAPFHALGNLTVAQVNLPIAALVWLMVIQMLLKIDQAALGQVRAHWRGIAVTVGVNWLVKPFSMALLGAIFIGWLFRPLLPARAGASVFKMREVSRHKSMQVLADYVRDAELFRDHAGEGFL